MRGLTLTLLGCGGAAWMGEPPPDRPDRGEAAPLPPADLALDRIAVGSCSRPTGDLSIFGAISALEPDLFLYAGDNVYGDVGSSDPTLPELRQAYADLARNPHFAAFERATPVLATWDDHDYGQNDAGAEFFGKEASERLFEGFWGEASLGGGHPGVYGARTFGPEGRRVQVVLLDTRSFRSPFVRGGAPSQRFVPDPSDAKTMLGGAQWSWLATALREPAEIRVIVSSIQVLADGHPFEAWTQLPAEQEHLVRVLRESGAEGVLLLSGDRHLAAIYRREGALAYPLYELTTSSLNVPLGRNASERGTFQVADVFTPANFGLVQIDWEAERVTLEVRDGAGDPVRELAIPFAELRVMDR